VRDSRESHLLRRQIRLVAYGPDKRETEDAMLAFGRNLRELRNAAGISQESLAVRCFMRRRQMWEIESGRAVPDVPGLLTLADGIGVPAARLVENLEAPVRRVGTAKVLDAITQQPGITQDALTVFLRLPDWYVTELTLYLKAVGAIDLGLGGWRAVTERPSEHHEATHG
jgi:transcriptional regulator with XRE-family HTH domain